ncbi:NADP-dependent 3-hydroxy acid dehydrogenase YdfG [Humitalea rosea]|uniref:NADP-dependent 3-hydroxy acid dehydrogenase YdfG n=1 Tax=Humitalea rosea TaxID=990373 RepID=A0A2W7IAR6_9PROT|nr:SDR family oxidoreductase [Humitalea rosea]PZW42165.1 NADP-dependent 3-hydroxy acid dehydrogenase YdfG [Humitalea rosea]
MLSAKRALVTGGGTGIGLACAEALTGAGAHVTVLGRRAAPLQAAIAAGAAAEAIVADVRALPLLAEFDILVHAAGAAESASFLNSDDALWERMLDANLRGAISIIRAVLPPMLAAKSGRIVTVASTAALKGYAYVSAYTAAKHALLGLTRALALECAGRGVTANAVCPGFTDTAIVANSIATIMARTGRSEAGARDSLTRHNPQARLVTPAEVAAAVLFLCSPAAGAVNGQAIAVDGGETA